MAWPAVVGLAGLALGCNLSSSTSSSGSPSVQTGPTQSAFDTESGPHAAGKKVFVNSGCFRCHTIDGVRGPVGGGMAGPPPGGPPPGGPGPGGPGPGGPKGGGRAPDLGKVAADPEKNVDWFVKFVRNPKSVKPESRMPAQGQIKDEDLKTLAEYLASLK